MVSQALKEHGGAEAASLRIAEQYIQAFSKIAKEGTTLLLPSTASNPASMMAQALNIYKSLIGNNSGNGLHEISHTELTGKKIKRDALSGETRKESNTTAKAADADHQGEPVFSLQSPNKED
uniref:STML2-like C-terminal extension domain-containing protein n=2 Tax=Davidia involucrata TaxID=16924 RepID=A0A5B7BP96_DAVIN